MPIDFPGIRARHRLVDVARRCGYPIDASSGDVTVCCPRPEHDDSTPSVVLHLDTDRYHCFGCGATGDVVQWICDIYGVGVSEAVQQLEAGAPLALPHKTGGARTIQVVQGGGRRAEQPHLARTASERVLAALAEAWRYYTFGTLHNAGVAYLAGRGIDVLALETEVGEPVVGRTPFKTPDQLVRRLRAKGFSDDELVDAGLARRTSSPLPGEPTKVVDYYRRRVLIAVKDDTGTVIGLIGRYDGDAKVDRAPKYINPPRTVVYDKARDLYRPSMSPIDPDGQVVVVEGTLDALAIAAAAARARLSSKFAPVCESGVALSARQVEQVMAMHERAPVLAADGDSAGGGANAKWAVALALNGRESAIVTWPDGEDPASWLATYGTAGLVALTRQGCLDAQGDQLRPRHSAPQVANALIFEHMPVEAAWRAALAPAERMAGSAHVRYLSGAVETLAPVVVAAGVDASVHRRGRVEDVILTVALYGRRLPAAAQLRYIEHAAFAIEERDLGTAGWARRRIGAAIGLAATSAPVAGEVAPILELGR